MLHQQIESYKPFQILTYILAGDGEDREMHTVMFILKVIIARSNQESIS